MFGTKHFQIIQSSSERIGEYAPTGTWDSIPRGTAMQEVESEDGEFCEPAGGTKPMLGVLTQEVSDTGPTYEQMELGVKDLPEKKGHKVSLVQLDDGDRIEVEGVASKGPDDDQAGLLVTSGTGAITSATALLTEVSTYNGRFRAAQSGDYVEGFLSKRGLTPEGGDTNERVEITIRKGGVKA